MSHGPTDDGEHQDVRDPLRAAFDDYRPAPLDVVPPRNVEHTIDDLRRLADGTTQVLVTHYEVNEHGVTRHTEWVSVTQPVTNSEQEN